LGLLLANLEVLRQSMFAESDHATGCTSTESGLTCCHRYMVVSDDSSAMSVRAVILAS
jgi:hypothetical protein